MMDRRRLRFLRKYDVLLHTWLICSGFASDLAEAAVECFVQQDSSVNGFTQLRMPPSSYWLAVRSRRLMEDLQKALSWKQACASKKNSMIDDVASALLAGD
jgi:hypothetical protein